MITAVLNSNDNCENVELRITDQGCGLKDELPVGELFPTLEINNNVN